MGDQTKRDQTKRHSATQHHDQLPEIEELGSRPIEVRSSLRAGRHGGRLGMSVPGALVGVVLVAASALGAVAFNPLSFDGAGRDTAATATEPAHGDGGEIEPKPTDAEPADAPKPTAAAEPSKEPAADPTKEPAADPTAKPTPKPEPKPDPTKPPSEAIAIGLGLNDGHPVVEWGSCEALDFDAYKVVRSTDSTVGWPLGKNDELFAVVGPGDSRRAWDKHSPTGLKLWYRAFCVRSTDAGYVVVRASLVKGISVPKVEPVPTPEPVALGFEAALGEDGFVHLGWEACNLDFFTYYKVVRSTVTNNPSYFPWTDGTELIAVLGEPGQTAWTDEAVASGQTIWYRVQCIGSLDGSKVLLGQTGVVAVTVP